MGGGVGATPLVGWLNVFNAELSPKRLWRGPGSQEVGGEGVVVTWCFTPSTIAVISWRRGRGRLYLSLRCHLHNDSCSDQSRFNVSLIVRDKVTRQCPQTRASEEKGEPKRIRAEVLLLTSLTPYH